jgi:hypothetical protein
VVSDVFDACRGGDVVVPGRKLRSLVILDWL